MSVFKRLLLALALLFLVVCGLQWALRYQGIVLPFRVFALFPQPRLARPYGMAPAAFDGFVRACFCAHIDPHRIGQTIGDHPLSVGYHKRDGAVNYRGQKLDYSAATDLGTQDLTRAQIQRFLEELARQGFAAFYREKGKWEGDEHIHAIYAPLPMKPQLRAQIRQWTRARQSHDQPTYSWQRKYRRNWR